jgi:hypothetical protein
MCGEFQVAITVSPECTMKKARKSESVERDDDDQISGYSRAQPAALRPMCDLLRELIESALPRGISKIWHGSPVWFMDDNPVVGYNATAKTVDLLFWNGQAFDEAGLQPLGKYRAAQAKFRDATEIDPKVIRRWLKKAKSDIFDSKTFFKRLRERKSNG